MHLHDHTNTLRFGAPLAQARGVVILLHGRGSSSEDIAGLSDVFSAPDLAYLAPSAVQGTWYPQRFFVPLAQNEPWLSSALGVIDQLVTEVKTAGLGYERIGLVGFSQGGCLALEYAVRHPRRYGFVAGLSAALIGPRGTLHAAGKLDGTPVLLGCSEFDPHIPREYVEESAEVFLGFQALVTKKIFPGGAHTVFPEEVQWLKTAAGTV